MTWVVVWAPKSADGSVGLFFGNPFSCQKGQAQLYLFILPVSALPRGWDMIPAQRWGFAALVPQRC